MKKIIFSLILLMSFQSYSDSMRDMIDQVFERQREMMEKMMNDDFFDSVDSFGSMNSFGNIKRSQLIHIDSKIVKKDNKTFEVVTIKADGDVSTFDIDIDEMIKITVASTQTQKNDNGSFTSSSSSSQVVPIPESGKYRADLTKRDSNSAQLYFEVDKNKTPENYGRSQTPNSFFKMKPRQMRPEYEDEEDKTVIVPERKT